MTIAMEAQEKPLDQFRSPARVLAAFFQQSRDKWKQKYMDLKTELKRFKVRVHDVSKSRDCWKEKSQATQQELESLQSQVQHLQSQLSNVHSEAPTGELQKTTLPQPV